MTESEMRILAAAMERILPGDHSTGASDAKSIVYAEWKSEQAHFRSTLGCLTTGLALVDSLAVAMWESDFADCKPGEQDAVLEKVQDTPHPSAQRFFAVLVKLTLAGFLCSPKYGGNSGGLGWKYIGFTPHPLTSGSEVLARACTRD